MRTAAIWIALVGCTGATGTEGPQDRDRDGFTDDVDCNDQNANVSPNGREICDGFDNDCDGDIDDADEDVDPAGFATFFADSDGDSFGDPNATAEACSPPEGFVPNDADCDDTRVSVGPGQAERCDGLDNDCDPYTDDGGVAFQQRNGEWTNLTNAFESGTAESPSEVPLMQAGTLFVCEGNYFVSLNVQADVDIRGLYGTERTILDGGGVRPTVWVDDPVTVDIQGVTLTNGADSRNTDGFGSTLYCGRRAVVSAEDVVLEGGAEMTYGGVVSAVEECELTLTTVEVRFGRADYGGLMYVSNSTVDLTQVGFLQGRANARGGAVAVGSVHIDPNTGEPTTLNCSGCSFQSNEAPGTGKGDGGGALSMVGASTVDIDGGSFIDNSAVGIGGAILYDTSGYGFSSLALQDGFFDKNTDTAGGASNDIDVPVFGARYLFEDKTVTVTCTELAGCN